MKVRTAIRAAAVIAALGLALTGCSAGGESTSDSDESLTLKLTQSAPPGNFSIGNWAGGESILSNSVYEPIVNLGVDGTLLPGVAESWEYSDDRTSLTFHIREGMTFTDGTPVDAAAVVASFEALRQGSSTSANWVNVSAVSAPDDSTAVITFATPDASLLPAMSGTVGAIGATAALTAESSKLDPVGSGAYVLDQDETVVGSKYVLERNPDYWDTEAYPYDRVEVSIIADATAAQNALRSGQVDVLPAAGTPEVVAQFPKGQFNSGENKPTAVGVLWIADRAGTVVPALGDERVRQAINLAFDRDTIASKLIGPGSAPTNQVFNPANGAFSDELLAETPFDVKKARSLMAEAGYADGFAVTMPSTVVSTSYESTITQSLADIGITVTWEPVPFQDFYSKVFGGSYGIYFMYNGFTSFDAQDLNASLSGVFNPFNSMTPELQALITTANAAPDDEQDAAFGAVNKYLVDQAWFAPLNYSTGFWVASNKVDYTAPTSYGVNLRPFAPAAN